LQAALALCNPSLLTEGDYPCPFWSTHGGLGIDVAALGLGYT
jgi:hypothetical protein